MWSSLSKLLVLPDDTAVHCAHEYTAANARFAVTVDPENKLLEERKARVDAARARVSTCAGGSVRWYSLQKRRDLQL